MDIPNTEPTEINPGDTLKWNRQDLSSNYPAPTWTLTYYFRGPDGKFDIAATADGSLFAISETPTTTGTYKPGDYVWTAKVSDGTDTHTIDSGVCIVNVDLATKSPGYDPRSHAKKTLDALEATILKKASKDQLEATIDGIAIKRLDPEQLRSWRKEYKAEYQKELIAEKKKNGKATGKRILMRFS